MLEIIALVALTRHIGKMVEAKGHKPGKYKWMTVGLWIGGEIAGAIVGAIFAAASDTGECLIYIVALLGAAAGAVAAYLIAKNVAPLPGFPQEEEAVVYDDTA